MKICDPALAPFRQPNIVKVGVTDEGVSLELHDMCVCPFLLLSAEAAGGPQTARGNWGFTQ
jgi:hypothetical protein